MMNWNKEEIIEQVELYVLDALSPSDKINLEQLMAQDSEVANLVNEHMAFMRLIQHRTKKEIVRQQLNLIHKENRSTLHKVNEVLSFHLNKYWKTTSIAASIAAVASILTFSLTKNRYDKLLISNNENLTKVANEVTKIKKDIQKKNEPVAQPQGVSKQTGTCFAINNNGYAITNAHVLHENADVYIYTSDNIAHKVKVIKQDEELDIAVLKIDEDEFKFSKNGLPYGLDTRNSSLAQRVFTLGYPKNSIVYSEGYISSEYGRNDDTSRYQMMLPSDPGVSGSPVFNEQGNIIAVINSRESMGSSTTYALKSKKLQQVLSEIKEIRNVKSEANLSTRTEQIKQYKDFVYIVKIF
jgi:S1-C subfamily serine protease